MRVVAAVGHGYGYGHGRGTLRCTYSSALSPYELQIKTTQSTERVLRSMKFHVSERHTLAAPMKVMGSLQSGQPTLMAHQPV